MAKKEVAPQSDSKVMPALGAVEYEEDGELHDVFDGLDSLDD